VPAAPAPAQAPGGPVDPGPAAPPTDVVVRFKADADAPERAAARAAADVRREETLPVAGMELVAPEPGRSVDESVAALERSDDVAYAEPDVRRRAFAGADDPYLGFQWALRNAGQTVGGSAGIPGADVDGDLAWDTTVGTSDVVVAVVDTGLDAAHPDLAPNLWSNPRETGAGRESNGVDDDGDGLIDDRMGWDWVARDNQPLDENGHGTHVSGTIAARGNDATGVAGVAWRASLMPLRVLDSDGSGAVSDAIKAYGYAAAHGARVVNASLGGSSHSRAERDAIAAAPNVLFVVAAGNDGADNDATPSYPCNYALANVVCVAATDQQDRLADFSNYGASTVDLAAPGVSIASTWPGRRWTLLDGTSMATPHVTGAAVLALAANPGLDVAGLRAALLSSAASRPALSGKIATGARLNAASTVAAATGRPAPSASATEADRGVPQSPPPAPAAPVALPAAPRPSSPPASVPAAAPAPAATPARAPDRIAPGLTVAVPARLPLARALAAGVRVAVRCSERCTTRLRLIADATTARRLGLGRRRAPVTLARAEVRIDRAGGLARRLVRGSAARRRLARAATARLTVRAEARDGAGNLRVRSTRLTLRAR
jgi:subtilisin family serine protease